MLTASALWAQTHPALARPDMALEEKRARADLATDGRFYETKPIIVADTP